MTRFTVHNRCMYVTPSHLVSSPRHAIVVRSSALELGTDLIVGSGNTLVQGGPLCAFWVYMFRIQRKRTGRYSSQVRTQAVQTPAVEIALQPHDGQRSLLLLDITLHHRELVSVRNASTRFMLSFYRLQMWLQKSNICTAIFLWRRLARSLTALRFAPRWNFRCFMLNALCTRPLSISPYLLFSPAVFILSFLFAPLHCSADPSF